MQQHSNIYLLPWLSSVLLLTACSSQKIGYKEQMSNVIRREQADSLKQKEVRQESQETKTHFDECSLLVAEGETAWQLAQKDWGRTLQQSKVRESLSDTSSKPSPKEASEPTKKQVYYLKKTCHKAETTKQSRQKKVVESKQWQVKNVRMQTRREKESHVLPSVAMWLAISLGLGLTFILTIKYIK